MEDEGYADLHFVSELLTLCNENSDKSNLDLYLHIGETKLSDDLMASELLDDEVSGSQNTCEGVLLNARRVGHGIAYAKHPLLLDILGKQGVAIEVAPISNMLLGYVSDITNHPMLTHFRRGYPIVLGSDDAGFYGYDNFTVDWYMIFMAWGLDLQDLRTLALNSFYYSAMSEDERKEAIEEKWKPLWERYIMKTHEMACNADLDKERPTFSRILPRSGAKSGSTKVHIYGRHFEQAICKEDKLTCIFGDTESGATQYLTNQHIICEAPERFTYLQTLFTNDQHLSAPLTVSVKVRFDDTVFDTGETFTYAFDHAEVAHPLYYPQCQENHSSIVLVNDVVIKVASFLCTIKYLYEKQAY